MHLSFSFTGWGHPENGCADNSDKVKDANPDDEATLLKIFEEGSDVILDKHSWKFGDDQRITYSRELNE